MPPTIYAGSLQSKKKSELQALANDLRLGDEGTREDLQTRIKKHLDDRQKTLEDDPRFSGLFGRSRGSRKGSSQPEPVAKRRTAGLSVSLDPVAESTPVKDLREVSTFLKNSIFEEEEEEEEEEEADNDEAQANISLSKLPPLPPSAETSTVISRSAIMVKKDLIPVSNASVEHQMVQIHPEDMVLQKSNDLLIKSRTFLSSSLNLWSLTAVFELTCILLTITPWQFKPLSGSSFDANIPYPPPLSVLQNVDFWKCSSSIVWHWFIPTLLVPAIAGTLISFSPVMRFSHGNGESVAEPLPFDPLTASIVRLAAHLAYPYDEAALCGRRDVLGLQWRTIAAGVGVAFAFAEAITAAGTGGVRGSNTHERVQAITH
ncbi:hypothetical protein E1B28_013458 [Marasmius oreades]|uniref:SAP domain-containing protein n=1 Tax=Marasmius oreades TaxID=181124 RepID=A0A9P7UM76_9AGAR|nr:uncharacterized protein E1B28_013458 [Marasmius oreades]KAG7087497.1 hypothetical protein E1B28_013458 [Marasmius oreades]